MNVRRFVIAEKSKDDDKQKYEANEANAIFVGGHSRETSRVCVCISMATHAFTLSTACFQFRFVHAIARRYMYTAYDSAHQ